MKKGKYELDITESTGQWYITQKREGKEAIIMGGSYDGNKNTDAKDLLALAKSLVILLKRN